MLGARVAIGQLAIGQFEAASGAYVMVGDPGSFTLTGQDAITRFGAVVTADAGSFTLTGQDAGLNRIWQLSADAGSFTLTGQDAILRAARTLVASPNVREASTTYNFVTFAALGGVALGQSVSESVAAPAYTYGITGYDTILRRGVGMQADAGTYTLTGQDAVSYFRRAIIAEVGSYEISGQVAALRVVMSADAGSYVFTGQDATFNRARRRIRGFARVGSSITARAA